MKKPNCKLSMPESLKKDTERFFLSCISIDRLEQHEINILWLAIDTAYIAGKIEVREEHIAETLKEVSSRINRQVKP